MDARAKKDSLQSVEQEHKGSDKQKPEQHDATMSEVTQSHPPMISISKVT